MPFAKCVVATGGGAVIRRTNWGYMQHGVVVWLDGPPELLASRVVGDGIAQRPLVSLLTADHQQEEEQQQQHEAEQVGVTIPAIVTPVFRSPCKPEGCQKGVECHPGPPAAGFAEGGA